MSDATYSSVRGAPTWMRRSFKGFRPVERMTVQFRAESFNLFNYPQFGQPNATIGSGTAELAPEGKLAVVTPRTDGAEGLALALPTKPKARMIVLSPVSGYGPDKRSG